MHTSHLPGSAPALVPPSRRHTVELLAALLIAACTAPPTTDEAHPPDVLRAEFVRDAFLFVHGTVAGHPATMLLDTGAGRTFVSAAFAERIGLRGDAGKSGSAVGVSGTVPATLVDDVPIELGRNRTAMTVVVLPIDVEPMLGRELQVVLGRNVFTDFVVEMDYANERVTLHDRESFRYQGPGTTLPLQRGELDAWSVAVDIEDLGPAWFDLDTGDSGTLTLHAPYVSEHRLLDGRPRGTAMGVGVGGIHEAVSTRLARVGLGGTVFRDVPVYTHESEAGVFARTRAAGNLGAELLCRFRLIVDGWRQQIHLEPNAERVGEPFTRNRSGLALAHRGSHLEVMHVVAGSPAAAAGFAVGDRIRTIDGKDVAIGYWDGAWRWVQQPQGTAVTIELVDGTRRTFTFGEVP
ncbi:MAG TPA: aspartyl protease family protein [Planctomycetota bacterium]|nr:aspartyl protease family protein [Planctomycetota bacterium]